MAKLNISSMQNDILSGESVKFPYFKKQSDGSYVYSGQNVEIKTLGELKKYLEYYKELKDYISKNFSGSIKKIYISSFANLTSHPSKSSGFFEKFKGKSGLSKKVTTGDLKPSSEDDRINLKLISGAVNSNMGVINKPFRISQIGANENNADISYILPEITENGVTCSVKDGKVLVNLVALSKNEGEEIQEYLYSQIDEMPEELKKNYSEKIECIFSLSNQLAQAAGEENGNSYYLSSDLAKLTIDVFGIDTASFLKKSKTQATKGGKTHGDGGSATGSKEGKTNQLDEMYFSSIQFDANSPFTTNMEPKDGQFFIVITPSGKTLFKATLDKETSRLIVESTNTGKVEETEPSK